MKTKFLSAIAFCLSLIAQTATAQTGQYRIAYDAGSQTYTVYGKVNTSYDVPMSRFINVFVTVMVTHGTGLNRFVPTQITTSTALATTNLMSLSRLDAPDYQLDKDYLFFNFNVGSANYTPQPIVADVEFPIFSFESQNGCVGDVYIIVHGSTEYDAAQSNSINASNAFSILGAGGDTYTSVYGSHAACSAPPPTVLNLKAILEGPYNVATDEMATTLNQRGLLPGQTPIGNFAIPTPSGQPFNTNPWNYLGTESIIDYPTTAVDWILVSLRTDSTTKTSIIAQKAGLLHSDGHISFLDSLWHLTNGERYFIVVEHRNHIGVMANTSFTTKPQIAFDFTTADAYVRTNPPTTGQKQIGTKWVMLAADGRKESSVTNFDINFNDQQRWKLESGEFDQYRYSDFNFDADINFLDSNIWKKNNGRYSGVPH